ncbi:MAG: type II toxin-antitoxin system VapC family toxin [Sphingomonadaceae bacterium]|nr:type II toxin-antitoxin system VapC family toxin [Sphingomonadaceae bacterium]
MAGPFFDSGILVDWLCGHPAAKLELERYRAHRISRIVWTQLLAAEPLESRAHMLGLLSAFQVVEVDARIASAAAELTSRSSMPLLPALILASAQVHGAILITRNTKDFPAEMPGIRVPYTQ